MEQFDPVSLEIMWSRLLNITEEMWTTVLRTAVSTIIASANDFGCEIMDADGRSIAHAYRSMPVFNMTMPNVTKEILKKYPLDEINQGDVFLTNDPWLCAGHLPDIAIVSPVFFQGRCVGFVGSIANTSDIGGSLDQKNVHDSYEEGIFFPICKLYEAGKQNDLVFEMFQWNVRVPKMVLTDIEAQVAANEVGARRVVDLLEEYQLGDLVTLSQAIREKSEGGMRQTIGQLKDGTYSFSVKTDGTGTPLTIAASVTIKGEEIQIDFEGSSPQVDWGGINCTLIYSQGHTYYALACLLPPGVPINEGCFVPINITAPADSIINCTFPASVGSRVNTGWYIHEAIFGALAEVLPERIQASNGLMGWLQTYGTESDGRMFNVHLCCGGGRGATSAGDGMGQNMFPSSASNVPVEVFEVNSPGLVLAKEYIVDSVGAGKHRGAPGQRVVVTKLPKHPHPLNIYFNPVRMSFAAEGIFGGGEGTKTRVVVNGDTLSDDPKSMRQGFVTIDDENDSLTLEFPSGGGAYPARERDTDLVRRDVRDGLVSAEVAKRLYGVEA